MEYFSLMKTTMEHLIVVWIILLTVKDFFFKKMLLKYSYLWNCLALWKSNLLFAVGMIQVRASLV